MRTLTPYHKQYIRDHGHEHNCRELSEILNVPIKTINKYAWYHGSLLQPSPFPNGRRPNPESYQYKPNSDWAYPDLSEYFGKRKAGAYSKGQLNTRR